MTIIDITDGSELPPGRMVSYVAEPSADRAAMRFKEQTGITAVTVYRRVHSALKFTTIYIPLRQDGV